MRKFGRFLLLALYLALYFNIGWSFAAWMETNVHSKNKGDELTVMQTIAGGGYKLYLKEKGAENRLESKSGKKVTKVTFVCLWPIAVAVITLSWIAFFVHKLLWLIFWGGIAKLLGLA